MGLMVLETACLGKYYLDTHMLKILLATLWR
jgi:hypothetical protein